MYDQAISLKPKDADYFNIKGIALNKLRQYDEALQIYDQTILLNTQNSDYYKNKGQVLIKLKRYNQAIQIFDQAILLDPHSPTFYLPKGLLIFMLKGKELANLNNLEKEIQNYLKALQNFPQDYDQSQEFYEKLSFYDNKK